MNPDHMTAGIRDRLSELKNIIRDMGTVAVAFSGGVDSTFLLAVAHEVLGDGCVAVTAESPAFPQHESDAAQAFCSGRNIRLIRVTADVMSDPLFVSNPKDRCYHCKKRIFAMMAEVAGENGAEHIVEGTNKSDEGDYRPGMRALQELGVRSPLREAGLTKQDIRELSREMGLDTWDMSSFACLATRIPYGQRITEELLSRIGNAESVLRDMGLRQYRVRAHGDLARIEVMEDDIPFVISNRDVIYERIKAAGFVYVTVDLAGYRTGSMNDVLS
ncbi:uncharacterized protein SAMN02910456_02433 [Ruminococcaceae bacterium YRB3002]|nr:uncharacterized protein SAMN02910456_02433 [Ruminococcaceae bacterium YRB3002]